jgi:biotin carboxyl carrier protein
MKRRIDLLDEHYTVTLFRKPGEQQIQVEEEPPALAELIAGDDLCHTIHLGESKADMKLVVKGETTYIHAFGRTFTLGIINPVEQASQDAGGAGNDAKAPMPGMVVEIHVAPGDQVTKGQAVITIESMKILTVIAAPRDGEIAKINFEPGATFDKNDILVTLIEKEEA